MTSHTTNPPFFHPHTFRLALRKTPRLSGVFTSPLQRFLCFRCSPPPLLILPLFWHPVVGCFPLDLPSVINHCHPTFRSRKPAASVKKSARAQWGRGKVKVCVCWGRGWGCKSEYFKVFTLSASLHFSQLVCEAFIAAHVRAVNMCVYVFVRSDALDQNWRMGLAGLYLLWKLMSRGYTRQVLHLTTSLCSL